jgi:hypothetical protein
VRERDIGEDWFLGWTIKIRVAIFLKRGQRLWDEQIGGGKPSIFLEICLLKCQVEIFARLENMWIRVLRASSGLEINLGVHSVWLASECATRWNHLMKRCTLEREEIHEQISQKNAHVGTEKTEEEQASTQWRLSQRGKRKTKGVHCTKSKERKYFREGLVSPDNCYWLVVNKMRPEFNSGLSNIKIIHQCNFIEMVVI